MSTCLCGRAVYGREIHDCCRYWLVEKGHLKCPACGASDAAARDWARREAEKAKRLRQSERAERKARR